MSNPARRKAGAAARRRTSLVCLAICALAGFLLGAGVYAWCAKLREPYLENAAAASALLAQCEEALAHGDEANAAAHLDAADKRLSMDAASLAQRRERCAAALALLRELDAIERFRWIVVDGQRPDDMAVANRLHAALTKHGIDPGAAPPEEAASRLAVWPLRERVVTVWDTLLLLERSPSIRAALGAADPEPYRDAVRDALRAGDSPKLRQLADQPAALKQPPAFLAFLAATGVVSVERRRALLAAAVRPGELPTVMALGDGFFLSDQAGVIELCAVPSNVRRAGMHQNQGWALQRAGDLDGAIAEYREALRLDPTSAHLHRNLGSALEDKGDIDAAIGAFREAIRLDPESAPAHINLGWALEQKGELTAAVLAHRTALRLDPKSALAHSNLGWVLLQQGDLDGAIAEFRAALRLDPTHGPARTHFPRAVRMRVVLPRLADVVAGQAQPKDPKEACIFAYLCARPFQQQYAAAVRLYAHAFAADTKLADDLAAAHRYTAAVCAVRAASGAGLDAPVAADRRATLRNEALGWLRADLELRRNEARSAAAAERRSAADALTFWFKDADLKGTRPEDDRAGWTMAETAAWDQLWSDVRTTLAQARRPVDQP